MIIIKSIDHKTAPEQALREVSQWAVLEYRWNQPREHLKKASDFAEKGLALHLGAPFGKKDEVDPGNVEQCGDKIAKILEDIKHSWLGIDYHTILINHEAKNWKNHLESKFWLNKLFKCLWKDSSYLISFYNQGQRRTVDDEPFPYIPLTVYHSHLCCSLYFNTLGDCNNIILSTTQNQPLICYVDPINYWEYPWDGDKRIMKRRGTSTNFMNALGRHLKSSPNVEHIVIKSFDPNDENYMD